MSLARQATSAEVVGKDGERVEGWLQGVGGVKDMKGTMFPSDHMFLKVDVVVPGGGDGAIGGKRTHDEL